MEGLTGNVFKSFTRTQKFAYGYNLSEGIVQLIIIPTMSSKTMVGSRAPIPDFTYRLVGRGGPLPCR